MSSLGACLNRTAPAPAQTDAGPRPTRIPSRPRPETQPPHFDSETMQPTALSALANPHRRQILRLVWDSELSAGQIAAHFDLAWPAISQNLRVLRDAGLVRERRQGNHRLY